MIIYISLLFFVSMLLLASYFTRDFFFYYCVIWVLILFSGLRVNVGMDYETYDQMFSLIRSDDAPFYYEPLNMLIIKIVDILGIGNHFIFFVYSILIMAGVSEFIKRFSPAKEFSIFLFMTLGFFYLSTFNGIRQWAAMSVILFCITAYIDRMYYRSILSFFIAVMLHFSAIIFLILPLLGRRWKMHQIILVVIGGFYLSNFAFLILEGSKYSIYIELIRIGGDFNKLLFFLYFIYVFLSVFILGYFSTATRLDRISIVMINFNLMSLLIMFMGWVLRLDSAMVLRLNAYFQIQMVVLVPMIIKKIAAPYLRLGVICFCLTMCVALFMNTLLNHGELHRLIPYKILSF